MKQKITPFWTLLEHFFSLIFTLFCTLFLCVTYEWRFWHAHVTHMRTFVCSRIRMAIPNWLTWTRRMGCWCEASLLVDCCQRQSRGTFPHCQPCSLLSHRSWFSLHSPWWSRKYNMHTMTHEMIRHKYSLKCEEITFYGSRWDSQAPPPITPVSCLLLFRLQQLLLDSVHICQTLNIAKVVFQLPLKIQHVMCKHTFKPAM